MSRIALPLAVITLITVTRAVETVSVLSAPFSFPTATSTAQRAIEFRHLTFACRPASPGSVMVTWRPAQTAVGTLLVTDLSGTVVARRSLESAEGQVVTETVLLRASGVYLVTLTCGALSRTEPLPVP